MSPQTPQQATSPNETWPVRVPKHIPNLRLHTEYKTDRQNGFKRFKGERTLQLELGIRVVRALMSENNRTTIQDGWPRSDTERIKAISKPPSKRTFRKNPWFVERKENG